MQNNDVIEFHLIALVTDYVRSFSSSCGAPRPVTNLHSTRMIAVLFDLMQELRDLDQIYREAPLLVGDRGYY